MLIALRDKNRGVLFRPLQEGRGIYFYCNVPLSSGVLFVLYKSGVACTLIRCAPSFRTRRYFSHHSVRGNSLHNYPSFAGETVGTCIDKGNSLIMPLRLRGGYATECHAFSYFSSSSALIFSPPCGSHPEYAHSVYKNALNECSFIRLRAKHAKQQALARNCGGSFYPCLN